MKWLILATVLSTPADAGYTEDLCAQRAVTASLVMRMRQNGWEKSTALYLERDTPEQERRVYEIIVDGAWEQPRYETDHAQRLAQDAFMRGVFNGCIEKGE